MGLEADEGGEVRLEYVRFAHNAADNRAARGTSFFFKNPGSTKRFPFPNMNGCTNTFGDVNWPVATNPIAEREYMDPGGVIIAGPAPLLPLSLPRRTAMFTDPIGREHPANSMFFHFGGGAATDGPTYLTHSVAYDVILAGSDDMPGQIFDDVLFMPGDFDLISPGAASPIPLPAATDQTFTFTVPDSMEPAGYDVMMLVGFTGAPTGPAVLCVEPLGDGAITVPAAMIDVVRASYPTGGTVGRQLFTHVVRELVDNDGPTGRRIDFVTVWCYASGFSVP